MKQTRDWWNTVTLILYKRYTIKSKLTYLKHQVIFKLTIRCGQRCMLCDSVLESLPSKCRTDSPSNWDFQTVQINTCHIYSTIPSSNRDIRQKKMILKCINIWSLWQWPQMQTYDYAGAALWDTATDFSPVSRNDVTRSPGGDRRDFLANLPTHATRASRSPRFCPFSPEIRKKSRLFCRLIATKK